MGIQTLAGQKSIVGALETRERKTKTGMYIMVVLSLLAKHLPWRRWEHSMCSGGLCGRWTKSSQLRGFTGYLR